MNAELTLSGWGRFPRSRARVSRPETLSAARLAFAPSSPDVGVLARGLGRSYGDAALNGQARLVLTEKLNRFLSFDPQTGVVRAEAGVSIRDLIETFLSRGWFPPVVPGTSHATLGGVFAADAHGKNHHRDGSFSNHVEEITLLLADGRVERCSRNRNADWFRATAGGMGLTGTILDLSLRLLRVESAQIRTDEIRVDGLDAMLALLGERDASHRYAVAWIDAMAKGRERGRGIAIFGDHARAGELPSPWRQDPLGNLPREKRKLPFDLPSRTIGRMISKLGNATYFRRRLDSSWSGWTSVDEFFFPLDRIGDWNRAYGKRGFAQYQCVFPPQVAHGALHEILKLVSESGIPAPLSVLKRFGAGNGLLSFPIPGYTLAMDFPIVGSRLLDLFAHLDRLVEEANGRVYLAKDAFLSPASFRRMYREFPAWKKIRDAMDPSRRFDSDLARRLRLHEQGGD